MKVARKLKTDNPVSSSGNSNDSNPFGDSNLNEKLVWLKKIKRDVTLAGERGLHFSVDAEVKKILQGKTSERLHMYKSKASLKEIHDKMLSCEHLLRREQPLDQGEGKLENSCDIKPQEKHIEDNVKVRPADETSNFEVKAMKAMGAMEGGDAAFGFDAEIVNLDSQIHDDKCSLRKPKYLNRVHTGYVWNKYNRIHYDRHNPPPKIVRGYKFNIFYPEHVDTTKAPTYTIDKDNDSNGETETCIIRFHAGPPYEDVAFRIVNQEWEYSWKNGFKCTFEHGILRLYFNFKHYSYRR